MKIKDVLVPLDFSANSLVALNFALSLVEPDGEVYLLHVIDQDFVRHLDEAGLGEAETVTAKLRARAEEQLHEIQQRLPEPQPHVEAMVVVGKPFAEILRIAADLDFSTLVVGMRGRRAGEIEEVLFGSTAEKILRAARIPVICVPADWTPPTDGEAP
jgi:nucleotide-binding universal stress UspA family protein